MPAAWDALLADSDADSVFLTREWMTAWWRAFGAHRQLTILSFYEGASLVALAPLFASEMRTDVGLPLRTLRIVGDGTHDSDHLDVICRRGREAHVARALCDWLVAHKGDWDLLELGSVRAESRVVVELLHELEARDWKLRDRHELHSAIALPASWDAYMASLSANARSTLRRKGRALAKDRDVAFHRCSHESEIPAYLDALFRMHTDRWSQRQQAGSFAELERRALYDSIARAALANGWLRLDRLEVDGKIAAVEFGLRYHDTHSFLQAGFSAELAELSPGVVLKTHILEELCGSGGRVYDFLHGDDDYKRRWSPAAEAHRNLQIARPRSAGAAFLASTDFVRHGKQWLYRNAPESMIGPLRRTFRKLRPYREELTE